MGTTRRLVLKHKRINKESKQHTKQTRTMSRTNFETLLEAGCHFGHLKRKWNPAMAPYIFMERNGIHILDLHKTVAKVDEVRRSSLSLPRNRPSNALPTSLLP